MPYKIGNLLIDPIDNRMASAIDSLDEFRIFMQNGQNHGKPVMTLSYAELKDEMPCFLSATLIYRITADDTDIFFYRDNRGGYLLKTECENHILTMRCHPDRRDVIFSGTLSRRQLKYALWMAYGIHALRYGKVAVHSSAVEYRGKVYLFLGESGTGKSTHTRLWSEFIPAARLLNDDSPIISCESDCIKVYGSPWSGKTPCYRADGFPLSSMTRLSQSRENEIHRLNILRAFGAIHPSMPPAFGYDEYLSGQLAKIESELVARIPICAMDCLPNGEAAFISNRFLSDCK